MDQILAHVMERLSNPEVLFGLAVRFFGVFIVLIIVMVALQLMGSLFTYLGNRSRADSRTDTASPPAPVPSEGARAADPHAPLSEALVPDEVAAAIGLTLVQALEESSSVPGPVHPRGERAARSAELSIWKLVGRQEALFGKTSLAPAIARKGR